METVLWFFFWFCVYQAVASLMNMESCLHVDTLGVLVLLKCVIRSGVRQGATEPGKTRATPRRGR